MRADRLVGIMNGIDIGEWDPSRDPLIPQTYDVKTVTVGKAACKIALFTELKLPLQGSTPLLGNISRLTTQKGVDLFLQVMPEILRAHSVALVTLGMGDPRLESMLANLEREFPDHVRVIQKLDNKIAHQIEAASDFFLMPSRFEPCGLNQMYSLRYGAIPIVRATGGLDDTVAQYDPKTKRGNGFKFGPHTPAAFRSCIEEALRYFDQPEDLNQLRMNGMSADHAWSKSAEKYVELFRKLKAGEW